MFVSTGLAYRRTNQLPRLAHDSQILTRGDDEDTHRRGRHGNISVRLASFVSGLVEFQPQVVQVLADPLADLRRMLAHTRSEYQSIASRASGLCGSADRTWRISDETPETPSKPDS